MKQCIYFYDVSLKWIGKITSYIKKKTPFKINLNFFIRYINHRWLFDHTYHKHKQRYDQIWQKVDTDRVTNKDLMIEQSTKHIINEPDTISQHPSRGWGILQNEYPSSIYGNVSNVIMSWEIWIKKVNYELTDLIEGDDITTLDIFIDGFSSKSFFDQGINRHQVIHNGHHDLQLLNTVSNWH